jgi:hypothetical protein
MVEASIALFVRFADDRGIGELCLCWLRPSFAHAGYDAD